MGTRDTSAKTFYEQYVEPLFSNLRFYVLLFSLLLSAGAYVWVYQTIPEGLLPDIRMAQIFGFIAIIYLYFAILAAPLTNLLPSFPWRGHYLHAQRALVVSAFYFGLLHALFAFYKELGGFEGLGFLGGMYITAAVLGLTTLTILFLLAITSVDWVVEKLTYKRWNILHKFIYVAGLVILTHVVIIGTHYGQLTDMIPRISIAALVLLLALEALRFDKYFRTNWPGLVYIPTLVVIFIGAGVGYMLFLATGNVPGGSISIHAQHLKAAEQAQQTQSNGLVNDPGKRFTVSIHHDTIVPGKPVELNFVIYDASSGSTDIVLQPSYDKLAHLVIVDSALNYYEHIHPTSVSNFNELPFTTTFPNEGEYRLYLNYQPAGAIEQQVAFSIKVGDIEAVVANQPVDTDLSKMFDGYNVKLQSASYSARKFSVGKQQIEFELYYPDGSPVTTLKPYLAAFGHLVMINVDTYDYVHVHPSALQPPTPDASGGPGVDFLPMGLYGAVKPGTYRVFAQFNPDNKLILADFTVRINP